MKAHFVCLIVMLPLVVRSQSDYAVTVRGDTLRGEIQIMTYDLQDRLLVARNKKKENYTALQAPTLFLDSALYKVQQLENGYRYMKVLKSGFLSLYAFRMKNQFTYDGRMLIKMDGSSEEVPNLGFKKRMSEYLADCDLLSEQIRKGELTRNDLEKIIDLYNECAETKKTVRSITSAALTSSVDESSPQLAALEKLQSKLKAASVSGNKDLDDLLSDLAAKLRARQTIPNYQIGALKEYLSGKNVDTELSNFLKTLEKP